MKSMDLWHLRQCLIAEPQNKYTELSVLTLQWRLPTDWIYMKMKSVRKAVCWCVVMTCANDRVLKVISELASDRKRVTNCHDRWDGQQAKGALLQVQVSRCFPCCHLQAPQSESVFYWSANTSLTRKLSSHHLLFVFFWEFKTMRLKLCPTASFSWNSAPVSTVFNTWLMQHVDAPGLCARSGQTIRPLDHIGL